ncbi:MAG: hypothetical protein MRERV_19c002 [Mycoplasmataceae bacterium RV_VA103A]|nr:MAG: hypothetical protein MRERV_19c002 [Mycoplasmataceae bacterium RV_VA103A]
MKDSYLLTRENKTVFLPLVCILDKNKKKGSIKIPFRDWGFVLKWIIPRNYSILKMFYLFLAFGKILLCIFPHK